MHRFGLFSCCQYSTASSSYLIKIANQHYEFKSIFPDSKLRFHCVNYVYNLKRRLLKSRLSSRYDKDVLSAKSEFGRSMTIGERMDYRFQLYFALLLGVDDAEGKSGN